MMSTPPRKICRVQWRDTHALWEPSTESIRFHPSESTTVCTIFEEATSGHDTAKGSVRPVTLDHIDHHLSESKHFQAQLEASMLELELHDFSDA